MRLQLNKRWVEYKIGLKQLKVIAKYSYNIQKDQDTIFELITGLDASLADPQIRAQFVREFENVKILSKQEIREYYSRGLGELGIDIDVLENMTIEEIDLAYQGYIHKLEIQANLIKLAVLQAKSNDPSTIKLTRNDVEIGSAAERNEILNRLQIKERKL